MRCVYVILNQVNGEVYVGQMATPIQRNHQGND